MAATARKREVPLSMRIRDEDLHLIDRGAAISGLSRTEFVRRAAMEQAQVAILGEAVIKLSPDGRQQFLDAIEAPARPLPRHVLEWFERPAPWDETKG